MNDSSRSGRGGTILLALLVACSAMLLYTNRQRDDLRAQLEQTQSDRFRLQRGEFVSAFTAIATDGQAHTVASHDSGSVHIVYLLTSRCPYCRATMPRWDALAKHLQANDQPNVRVTALTSDSLPVARALADSMQFAFPLVSFPDLRTLSLYRAQVVPQTAVIRGDGRILYVRHGAITTDAAIDSIVAVARAATSDSIMTVAQVRR